MANYKDAFQPLFEFARRALGVDHPLVTLWYNSVEERLDFVAMPRETRHVLYITFEPGYPCIDFDEEMFTEV